MRNVIKDRVLTVAEYILITNMTIRELAVVFKCDKSTIHLDLRKRLPLIDEERAKQVDLILENHKSHRHLNGGRKTKEKWEKLRKIN